MRAHRGEIALLAAGTAMLALLAYGGQRARENAPPASVFSIYDTGPNGYRALFRVLRAAGVPVRAFARPLPLLDRDVGTLVISSYDNDPAAKELDTHDASRLRAFVTAGGRLVVLDTDFAGERDFTPGVGTSMRVAARAAIALARSRYTTGVTTVRAPIEAAFPFAQRRGAIALLANDRGIVATAYRVGTGEVVAITVPAIFANAHLRQADNLAFAYDVVAGHGPAAFDEYVHGYDDDRTLWQVLPLPVRAAFWIVCGIVVLAVVGANVPFAPPVPADPPDARDTSAYVDAMAGLMRRARAARSAIAAFANDAARRTRGRHSTAASQAVAELTRLRALRAPPDAALVRAAALDFRLRKELP